MTTRRTFLKLLSAGTLAAFGGPPSRRALADVAASSGTEFFVFVHAAGGWDVTLWADPRNEARGIIHPASTENTDTSMVKRWVDTLEARGSDGDDSPGSILALAYPDRIAKNRGGGGGAFLLASGRGGAVDKASALAREPFLAVAELTGAAAASRIVLAAPITLAEIEARFAG